MANYAFIEMHQMRPGDRVLLTADLESEEAMVITATLRERFPDVEFTMLNGIGAIQLPKSKTIKLLEMDDNE